MATVDITVPANRWTLADLRVLTGIMLPARANLLNRCGTQALRDHAVPHALCDTKSRPVFSTVAAHWPERPACTCSIVLHRAQPRTPADAGLLPRRPSPSPVPPAPPFLHRRAALSA